MNAVFDLTEIDFLRTVPHYWKPFPADPEMKIRLHGKGWIERGFAPGIFGMYRVTEVGFAVLQSAGASK